MKSQRSISTRVLPLLAAVGALYGLASLPAHASSHREAPSITAMPKVDATDFYMFNSYEPGRAGFVTLIANYVPLQDAYGGPNYFKMDPNAIYEIHVDNNGDAKEDITFQFKFKNTLKDKTLSIGGKNVSIPLTQFGGVTDPNAANLNVNESFTVDVVRGDRRTGRTAVTNSAGGSATFDKPVDNIGTKTIPDYPGYAAKHIYTVAIPGCATPGKVFVGQRKDPFAVNLGTIFDLVQAPAAFLLDNSNKDAGTDDLQFKNVTSLAIEVPTSCLTAAGSTDTVIGGWTSASVRQGSLVSAAPKKGHDTGSIKGGAYAQVSRLGMPLVNEVVIGLGDKDKFNASRPSGDGQFADYVTNPTLPALLEIALGAPGIAPTNFPRLDLVTTFLTGIKGVNQPATVTASEMLRLNTAIPATPYASQNRLGLLGGLLGPAPQDLAGYPNGRRPNDDVVDISLIAVMGGLCVANGDADTFKFGAACKPSAVPLGAQAFGLHDGVDQAGPKVRAAGPLLAGFPYIGNPIPGAK